LGQLRSKQCPICDGANGGKWTCPPCTAEVNRYRELIRNLQSWRSLFEALEVPDILRSETTGREVSLWDIEYFYEQRSRLPEQMRVAIELCLYENVLERDAAKRMGTSETNPVAVYATVGLTKLLRLARNGEFPLFKPDSEAISA